MRKLVVLLLILLVGCTANVEKIKPQIDQAITSAIQAKISHVLNQNTPYYSYYLPPHIGRRFVNEVATILVSNNDEIVLQLDVPSIISQRFYRTNNANKETLETTQSYYYEYEGVFIDDKEETHPIKLTISENQDRFVIYIQSDNFILSSSVKLSRVEEIVNDMIVILRSAVARKDKVVVAYSNKQVINYRQQVLEIFEQVAPESGTLVDMDHLIKGELDFSQFDIEGQEDGIKNPETPNLTE